MTEIEVKPERLPAVASIKYTPVGLQFSGELTMDEYCQTVNSLAALNHCMAWFWGDLLNAAEAQFGEMYTQALDESHLEKGTLKNAKYVCSRIAIGERRPGLSYAHHYEVAKFDKEQRDKWLDEAETKNLTVREMRTGIRKETGVGKVSKTFEEWFVDWARVAPDWHILDAETQRRIKWCMNQSWDASKENR